MPSKAGTVAGLIPALAIAVIAIWEIASASSSAAGSGSGSEPDWEAAAATVRRDHAASDLIVFAPSWIDPIGRMHVGDLIPVDMAARMDAARYPVIWEISARGAGAPETAGLTPELSKRHGDLVVRRYRQHAAEVTTDFVAEAQASRMTVAGRMARHVRIGVEEVGFEPHRCISVEPAPDQTVTLGFRGVKLGARLVGYVGLADVFTRRDVRDPARLDVAIAGKPVASRTVGVDDGWVRFEVATTPGAAQVTFQATALGAGARQRQICFAAEARR